MEVNLTNYSITNQAAGLFNYEIEEKKTVDQELQGRFEKKMIAESRRAMMDLEDVQKFLYMLIGSEIKVESERDSVGRRVNTIV